MQYLHFYKEVIGKMRAYAAKVQKQGTAITAAPLLLQIYEKNATKANSVKMTGRLC